MPEPAGSAPPEKGHIAALDGLRGVAVLMVLALHFSGGSQSANPLLHAVKVAAKSGWAGVSLFFVLSGFLISGILWQGRHQSHWWRRFIVRRSLRIFPLYYLALGLVLLSTFLWHTTHAAVRPLLVYVFYLQNVESIPHEMLGLTPLPVYHLWSLAIEEQFYLVWPLLLLAMPTARRALQLCAAVFALSFFFRFFTAQQFLAYATPSRIGEMAVGAWLAVAIQEHPEWIVPLRRFAPAIFWAAMAAVGLCAWPSRDVTLGHPPMYVAGLALLPLAFAALVLMTMHPGRVSGFLSFAPLRHLGAISYGVYVYHVLLYPVMVRAARLLARNHAPGTEKAILVPVSLMITLVVAELSYRLFERPILRLKDRLAPDRSSLASVLLSSGQHGANR
jgi:peptidoglycan/LPS O-acetylase OafA/YrhL